MKTKLTAIPRCWAWHHRALLRLGHELAGVHGERTATLRTSEERGGVDGGEIASDEAEHGTLLAEIRQEQAELAEIEAALGRLREGIYGVCEVTDTPIEAERLRALPWTRYSAAAAARRERAGRDEQMRQPV